MTRLCIAILVAFTALVTLSARAERSGISVLSWQPPQRGWLYLSDGRQSRVFLLDPSRGEVVGAIAAEGEPDVALSPRGDRLYVTFSLTGCKTWTCDRIAVVDTSTGRVLSTTPFSHRLRYKGLSSSKLVVSPDGRTLYVLTWEGVPSRETPIGLTAFDTVRQRILDNVIDLGNCGGASLVAWMGEQQFAVHCSKPNALSIYQLTAPDRAAVAHSIQLPFGNRLFAGYVYHDAAACTFLGSADGGQAIVTNSNGGITTVNLISGDVSETPIKGDQRETVISFVSPGSAQRSRAYAAVGPYDGSGGARQIRIFDAATWTRLGVVSTSVPIQSAIATSDGSMIYAVAWERDALLAIDPIAMRELRTMHVGATPVPMAIAP